MSNLIPAYAKQQYLFSLFLPNIFDTPLLVSILETLISSYGIIPTGVKADAYTHAGIDSKHSTRIDTLVFRPRDHPEGVSKVEVSRCSPFSDAGLVGHLNQVSHLHRWRITNAERAMGRWV